MSKEIKQTDAELALSSIKSQFVNLNRFKLRVEADADLRSLTALHLDINKVISYVTGLRPQLEALDEQYDMDCTDTIIASEIISLMDSGSTSYTSISMGDAQTRGVIIYGLTHHMDIPTIIEYFYYQLDVRQGITSKPYFKLHKGVYTAPYSNRAVLGLYRDYIDQASSLIVHMINYYKEHNADKGLSKTANTALALDKYPKYFKYAHDITAHNYNELMLNNTDGVASYSEELVSKWDTLLKGLPKPNAYKFSETDPELILVKPNTARDIVIEGQQLSHCVGGYTGRVAKGDTNIFFLRHKNSPDVPWVTVEVKNNGVIKQAYGHSDSIIPKVAHRYLHAWAKKQGYKETYATPNY